MLCPMRKAGTGVVLGGPGHEEGSLPEVATRVQALGVVFLREEG